MNDAQTPARRVQAVIDAVEAITEYEDRFFQQAASHKRSRTSAESQHREVLDRQAYRQVLILRLGSSLTALLPLAGTKRR